MFLTLLVVLSSLLEPSGVLFFLLSSVVSILAFWFAIRIVNEPFKTNEFFFAIDCTLRFMGYLFFMALGFLFLICAIGMILIWSGAI